MSAENVAAESESESVEDLATEASVVEVAAENLSSLKEILVGRQKDLINVFNLANSGIVEINGIAQKLISRGGGAAAAGKAIIAGLEKAAAILDIKEIIPAFREAYGTASVAVNSLISEVESLVEEVDDARSTCELIRTELINSQNKHHQLSLFRPTTELFKHVEGASDTFGVLSNPESVKSRLKFINDKNDAIGIAVVISQTTDSNYIQAFYFSDYLDVCDGVFGRKLNLSHDTADGGFVYKAVVDLAVRLADSVVTAFGPLPGIINKSAGDTGHGLKFASDKLDEVYGHESRPDDVVHVDTETEAETSVEEDLEGSTDASVDDDGEVITEAEEFAEETSDGVSDGGLTLVAETIEVPADGFAGD